MTCQQILEIINILWCVIHMYLLKAKGKHKTCNTLYFYIQCINTNTKAELSICLLGNKNTHGMLWFQ